MNKKIVALAVSSALGVSSAWAGIQVEYDHAYTHDAAYCHDWDHDYEVSWGLDSAAVAGAFAKTKVWVKGHAKLKFEHEGNAGAIKAISLKSAMTGGNWAVTKADAGAFAFSDAQLNQSLGNCTSGSLHTGICASESGTGVAGGLSGAEAEALSLLNTFNYVNVTGPNLQTFDSGLYVGSLYVNETEAFAGEFAAAFADVYVTICLLGSCSTPSDHDKAFAFGLAAGRAIALSGFHFSTIAHVKRTPGPTPYWYDVDTDANAWSLCDADAWAKAKAH